MSNFFTQQPMNTRRARFSIILESKPDHEKPPPEPEDITEALVKQVGYELGLITLCWPEIVNPVFEKRTKFPKSYYTTNNKERLVLLYAENFRRQFGYFYGKRKQIILAAYNECGVQKLVCTTIRPTILSFLELKTWKGCAQFVADHIKYELLEKPTMLLSATR